MNHVAIIGQERVEVELRSTDLDAVRARVGGRDYRIALREVAPGVFWTVRDGRSIELQVAAVDGGYDVRLGGRSLRVELLDRRAILAGRGGAGRPGRREVRAPMPGRVVRLLVEEGAAVETGAGLVVVEAMKMQNEIRSAGPGVVERIAVAEGQAVDAGELLVVVGT